MLNQMRSSLRTKELIFVDLINFLGLRTRQLIYLLTGWILSDHAIGYAP